MTDSTIKISTYSIGISRQSLSRCMGCLYQYIVKYSGKSSPIGQGYRQYPRYRRQAEHLQKQQRPEYFMNGTSDRTEGRHQAIRIQKR